MCSVPIYDWGNGDSVDVSLRMVSGMVLVLQGVGAILGNRYGTKEQNKVVSQALKNRVVCT